MVDNMCAFCYKCRKFKPHSWFLRSKDKVRVLKCDTCNFVKEKVKLGEKGLFEYSEKGST